MIFEYTEVGASDYINCTVVNCELVNKLIITYMS